MRIFEFNTAEESPDVMDKRCWLTARHIGMKTCVIDSATERYRLFLSGIKVRVKWCGKSAPRIPRGIGMANLTARNIK